MNKSEIAQGQIDVLLQIQRRALEIDDTKGALSAAEAIRGFLSQLDFEASIDALLEQQKAIRESASVSYADWRETQLDHADGDALVDDSPEEPERKSLFRKRI